MTLAKWHIDPGDLAVCWSIDPGDSHAWSPPRLLIITLLQHGSARNPNHLEQRMGRVDRYGQKCEVTVINLVAAKTREGEVMTRLLRRP